MTTETTEHVTPDTLTWALYRTLPQGKARATIRALATKHKGRMNHMAESLGVDRKTLIRERAEDAWFATMLDKVKRAHRAAMTDGGYAKNAKRAASKKRATKPEPETTEETETP